MSKEQQNMYDFLVASSDHDYNVAKTLFNEYVASLDFNLWFQDFEGELTNLKSMYGKPSGGIILIRNAETSEFIGCAGIRKSEEYIAELKRMFIKPDYRHYGFGKRLLEEALTLARQLTYEKVRLDTMPTMISAINLYRQAGFVETERYCFNPDERALYFELKL